jgi:hypothetical protein
MPDSVSLRSKDAQSSIFSLIKPHLWRFLLAGIMCAAIAFAIAISRPIQWKAYLLLQIGQVGNASGILVDPNNVLQRIQFPGYTAQILNALNLTEDINADPHSKLIRSSFTGSIVKGGNLLILSVNGFTKEEAIVNLQAAFSILDKEHEQLLMPVISRLKKNLDETNSDISKIETERQSILTNILKIDTSAMINNKFSESVLTANMLKLSDSELRGLREQKNVIEEQLSPARTFNTKILNKIYVPFKPESRYLGISALAGLLTGLLLMGIWTVSRDKALFEAVQDLFHNSNENSTEGI